MVAGVALMPLLVEPDVRFHASFLRAMEGFAAEGRGGAADTSMIGRDLREWGGRWHDPAVFADYVAEVRALSRPETPRPAGLVPATTLWWTEGDEFHARVALVLPAELPAREQWETWKGLPGVPPGQDVIGAAILRLLALEKEVGLDRVLVTCDHDNVGSRKVIEACGGVFEDRRGVKLRYWVPTS